MESSETPKQGELNLDENQQQERPPVILAKDQLIVKTKDGIRVRNIDIVAVNEPDYPYRFRAVDPKTGEGVELTKTKIASIYTDLLNEEPPRHLAEGLEMHHRIKKAKSKKPHN